MLAMVTSPFCSSRVGPACVAVLFLLGASACFAEWTQTIHCPAGHIRKDIRQDAGRQEFCALEMPGALLVKDGPFRFWFNEDMPGSEGDYRLGREVGKWHECDRFDRCRYTSYEAVFPEEKKRAAFRPEVPLTFRNGKYRFDFASCRSAWVVQTAGDEPLNFNIGGSDPYRCFIAVFPESVLEHGGEGAFMCSVPYSVGVRSLSSLDLIHELPRIGLPQFCWPGSGRAEPLMIREGPGAIAYTTDVVCASLAKSTEAETLRIKLNRFATDLVLHSAQTAGTLNTLLCLDALDGPTVVPDTRGRPSLLFELSSDRRLAANQKRCIRKNLLAFGPCQY